MSIRSLSVLIGGLALAGCVDSGGEAEAVSGAVAFRDTCAACHGTDARGGGPLASGLSRPPPDLTGLSARNGGIFPRNSVMSTIDGYARGSHFAPDMPEFGAGDMGALVIVENPDGSNTPTPALLLALADYLESVQEP